MKRLGCLRGRAARLATRVLAAAAACIAAVTAIGWQPATIAVIAGALTWLALAAHKAAGLRR